MGEVEGEIVAGGGGRGGRRRRADMVLESWYEVGELELRWPSAQQGIALGMRNVWRVTYGMVFFIFPSASS